jgi:hypothetical protein
MAILKRIGTITANTIFSQNGHISISKFAEFHILTIHTCTTKSYSKEPALGLKTEKGKKKHANQRTKRHRYFYSYNVLLNFFSISIKK